VRRDRKARGSAQLSDGTVLDGPSSGVASYGLFVDVGGDRERQRISLSIKRLAADPWERYVGQLETGSDRRRHCHSRDAVRAFACVADGVDGPVHISEIAQRKGRRPDRGGADWPGTTRTDRGHRPGAAAAFAVCSPHSEHVNVVRKTVITRPERIIGTR